LISESPRRRRAADPIPQRLALPLSLCGQWSAFYGPFEPYVGLVREQGYAPASVHEHVRVIAMFSQSVQRSGCEIRDLDEAVVERFLYRELKGQWPHVSAPATLRRLLKMLRQMGATRGKPTAPRNPAQQLTDDYRRFLLVERSLSVQTAKGWLRFIDKFLCERFGVGPLNLSELRATDVTAFVQRHAHRHSPSEARRLVTSLRSFFRYLRYKGLIVADLETAVPRVARWALSCLPKHLPAVEVQRVLDCCDQTTSTGSSEQACELIASLKKPAITQSVSAEKLPVARLLPCLSSELKDVARHERDPDCSIAASQCSPSRWPGRLILIPLLYERPRRIL
jgi:hypothetical protein